MAKSKGRRAKGEEQRAKSKGRRDGEGRRAKGEEQRAKGEGRRAKGAVRLRFALHASQTLRPSPFALHPSPAPSPFTLHTSHRRLTAGSPSSQVRSRPRCTAAGRTLRAPS